MARKRSPLLGLGDWQRECSFRPIQSIRFRLKLSHLATTTPHPTRAKGVSCPSLRTRNPIIFPPASRSNTLRKRARPGVKKTSRASALCVVGAPSPVAAISLAITVMVWTARPEKRPFVVQCATTQQNRQ